MPSPTTFRAPSLTLLAGLGLLLGGGGTAAAQSPPVVAIELKVVDPGYVLQFQNQIDEVEEALGDAIRERLAKELKFLRFDVGDAPTAHLHLRLGDPQAAPVPGEELLAPVHLRAHLDGPGVVEEAEHDWLVFSLDDALLPVATIPDLVSRVGAVVVPKDCCDDWVTKLFSKIRIAGDAHVFFDSLNWLWTFPFSLDDLGAQRPTIFQVKAEMRILGNARQREYHPLTEGDTSFDEVRVPERFRGRAMATITNAEKKKELAEHFDLEHDEAVRIRHIGVLHYVKGPPPPPPLTPPTDIDLGDGR